LKEFSAIMPTVLLCKSWSFSW